MNKLSSYVSMLLISIALPFSLSASLSNESPTNLNANPSTYNKNKQIHTPLPTKKPVSKLGAIHKPTYPHYHGFKGHGR